MKRNRDYFSWSQYNLWKTSKREFWKMYNQNAPQRSNKFYDKGKELAQYMEDGHIQQNCKDPMLEHVADRMPRLAIMEHKLEVQDGDLKLLGYVDSGEKDGSLFIEYKSGKIPWTREKVEKHDQLLFYAYMYYKLTGNIPRCILIWVETMETPEGLMYTGEITSFDRIFTLPEILDFGKEIALVVKEIEEYEYKELEIEKMTVDRYAQLAAIKKETEAEMLMIIQKVHAELTNAKVTFGKGYKGNFIISRRKNWKYSPAVDTKKTELKDLQSNEQKSGVAKVTTSESISFKFNKNK